jgi:hypothetical protein
MAPRCPCNTFGPAVGSGDVRSQSLIVASYPPVASQRPSGLKAGDAIPGCSKRRSEGGDVVRFKRCTNFAGLESVANHLPFALNTRPAPTSSSSPETCETASGSARKSHRRNLVGCDAERSDIGWPNGEETFHSRAVMSLLADASHRPSRLKPTEEIGPSWPFNAFGPEKRSGTFQS